MAIAASLKDKDKPKYGAGVMPDYLDPNAPDFLEDPVPVKEMSGKVVPPQSNQQDKQDDSESFGL